MTVLVIHSDGSQTLEERELPQSGNAGAEQAEE